VRRARYRKKTNVQGRFIDRFGYWTRSPVRRSFAEQGNSSAWGTVGWGPVIPTQSLTPKERQWNFDNQAKYEAQDSAASMGWVRFSFFR
jgi:hypothetical protein